MTLSMFYLFWKMSSNTYKSSIVYIRLIHKIVSSILNKIDLGIKYVTTDFNVLGYLESS